MSIERTPHTFTVVITTEHEEESLVRLLEAVCAQSLPADRYDVLVVDYSEESRQAATEDFRARTGRNVRHIRLSGAKPFEARNAGLDNSAGDIVVFTDDDCTPGSQWLETYDRAFDDTRLGMAGGADKAPPSVRPFLLALDYVLTSFCGTGGMRGGCGTSGGSYYPRMWNMALSKRAVDSVGGFDTSLPGAQEFDMAQRVRQAGYSVRYLPDCVVWHRRDTNLSGHWRASLKTSMGRAYASSFYPESRRLTHAAPALAGFVALTLALAAPKAPLAMVSLTLLGGMYLGLIAGSGVHAAISLRRPFMLPVVPALMFQQHLAHGLGFTVGFARGLFARVQKRFRHE